MLQVVTAMSKSENTVTIYDSQVDKAIDGVIEAIKKELPEETLTREAFEYIAEKLMERIDASKILV